MSTDKIGAITRVAVGIKPEHHGIVLDVLNRLNSPDAAAWQAVYAAAHQQGLATRNQQATPAPNTFPITTDYNQTLLQMIAAGHYDRVNSNITPERFPLQGYSQALTPEIVHFDRNMSSDDVVAELTRRGLRPATIAELLAFGAAHPEEQRKFPVVALGSVAKVDGDRDVPCLYGGGTVRDLLLRWWGGGWGGLCRFLAVRN